MRREVACALGAMAAVWRTGWRSPAGGAGGRRGGGADDREGRVALTLAEDARGSGCSVTVTGREADRRGHPAGPARQCGHLDGGTEMSCDTRSGAEAEEALITAYSTSPSGITAERADRELAGGGVRPAELALSADGFTREYGMHRAGKTLERVRGDSPATTIF